MSRTITGVNLGGWLIAEKWLTPALFAGMHADDEFTLSKSAEGRRRIKKHRDTFITETDFKWCKEHGIELVRLPVGYWLFKSDDYVVMRPWVDKVMKWAEKHGVDVLLDVHAAPGSQNGEMHSGRIGEEAWSTSEKYRRETLDLLREIAERYGDSSALWGIELLNEPSARIPKDTLTSFYQAAYNMLSGLLPDGVRIVFHDSFRPLRFSGCVNKTAANPVVMDVHWYAFSSRLARVAPFGFFLWQRRWEWAALLRWLNRKQPVLVGEWSSVLPQGFFDRQAKQRHYQMLARHITMQRRAYGKAVATMYWNYKAEGRGMWNYRALVEDGIIGLD